jgi:glucose/arabinose dehydrogenase
VGLRPGVFDYIRQWNTVAMVTRIHTCSWLTSALVAIATFMTSLAACGGSARLPLSASIGPNPTLPEPDTSLLPVTHIAPARGWPSDGRPIAADGIAVQRFADGLDHPRWLHVLPNGDVLVAETNAPPRPDDAKGVKGWVMRLVMKRAGAAVPSADRITLLRDNDGDGIAEKRAVFLKGLHSPFGMAVVGGTLYVANTDALVRFPYEEGQIAIAAAPTTVAPLPAGPINHHWTKNVIANASGDRLYVTVGSNSNAAENGIENETERAAILEIDPASGSRRIFAFGLRNPVGLAWEPKRNALWTTVNERDELGSDLVPDYMTAVRDGGFYGWPYSYFGQHVDARVTPTDAALVARAIKPDYALGAHTASLGLAYSDRNALPDVFHHGMFVGQHGSWNRKPRSGYKVIFVPFNNGEPSGDPRDVLTGFVDADGYALGRPAGVAIDGRGGLLVADDVGNVVWRAHAASQ